MSAMLSIIVFLLDVGGVLRVAVDELGGLSAVFFAMGVGGTDGIVGVDLLCGHKGPRFDVRHGEGGIDVPIADRIALNCRFRCRL